MVLVDPIETMERDRLWLWPGVETRGRSVWPGDAAGHCTDPDRLWARLDGTLSDRAERRWPLPEAPDSGGVKPWLDLGRSGDARRLRSEGCCCFDWLAVDATFLKVIVHLTSSPAKTVCSCQRMKTRMLLDASCAMADSAQ